MKAKKSIKERALLMIEESGDMGFTTSEITARVGGLHQTVSARVHELIKAGKIKDSQRTRKTERGIDATVWVATTLEERRAAREAGATTRERISAHGNRVSEIAGRIENLSYDELHNVLEFIDRGAVSMKKLGDQAVRDHIASQVESASLFGA